MADSIDPRILTAHLEPTVGPARGAQPTPAKGLPALPAGQPTFVESLEQAVEHLRNAEKNIPDPSTAQNSTDIESLYKKLGALHEMTMDAHVIIAQLGQQIVSPGEAKGHQDPPPGEAKSGT